MPTHYKGSREQVRALNCYITLMRAARSVEGEALIHLRTTELTLPQFAVLEALYHLGPLLQRELAEKLLCTPGNITGVIDKLEKAKLVKRGGNQGDRRCNSVILTAKGKTLIAKIFPPHLAAIVRSFEALSSREQDTLHDLCKKLGLGRSEPKLKS